MVQHKTLEYNQYQIHYFTCGNKAGETIVCLHPAFADHNCFNLNIDHLAEKYYIIAIDMLGHGLSHPRKTSDKMDETPQHIKAILTQEKTQKVHLCGVSLGSLMAQYFAELNPELCLSLTIVGGYNINLKDAELIKAQRNEGLKWIWRIVFSMESFRRYVAEHSVWVDERKEGFHEMALKFTRKSLVYMSGLGVVLKNRVTKVSAIPKLIIIGEHDIPLAKKKAKELHNSLQNSTYHLINDAGHCVNMDNPSTFNILLLNWLQNN